MKMISVRFFYLRARIFGWILLLGMVAYGIDAIYSLFSK
jgi:hypothetical protein